MKNNPITTRVSFKMLKSSGSLLEKLAVDVLGGTNLLRDPGLRLYQLPDGTVLEIYGAGSFHPQEIFEKGSVVLSFQVENIEDSVNQMLEAGAQSVDGIIRTCTSYAYCHLIVDDNHIIGLHQVD